MCPPRTFHLPLPPFAFFESTYYSYRAHALFSAGMYVLWAYLCDRFCAQPVRLFIHLAVSSNFQSIDVFFFFFCWRPFLACLDAIIARSCIRSSLYDEALSMKWPVGVDEAGIIKHFSLTSDLLDATVMSLSIPTRQSAGLLSLTTIIDQGSAAASGTMREMRVFRFPHRHAAHENKRRERGQEGCHTNVTPGKAPSD